MLVGESSLQKNRCLQHIVGLSSAKECVDQLWKTKQSKLLDTKRRKLCILINT